MEAERGPESEDFEADNVKSATVFVFAYNEQELIINNLKSLERESENLSITVYVLANGCKDNTAVVVREFRSSSIDVNLIEIEFGDKANAWNQAIHELSKNDTRYVFFMDGDVTAFPKSLTRMIQCADNNPEALAVSSLPKSGRTQSSWSDHIRKVSGMPGCLYLLKGTTVDELKRRKIFLPIGFIGEDLLLQILMRSGLDPSQPQLKNRIALCEEAGFEAPSLSPFSRRDALLYWNRRKRNSLRSMQNKLLFPKLLEEGLSALPAKIDAIYSNTGIDKLSPRSSLIDNFFDRMAIKHIKNKVQI